MRSSLDIGSRMSNESTCISSMRKNIHERVSKSTNPRMPDHSCQFNDSNYIDIEIARTDGPVLRHLLAAQ
jgi:hypothetical protein